VLAPPDLVIGRVRAGRGGAGPLGPRRCPDVPRCAGAV